MTIVKRNKFTKESKRGAYQENLGSQKADGRVITDLGDQSKLLKQLQEEASSGDYFAHELEALDISEEKNA